MPTTTPNTKTDFRHTVEDIPANVLYSLAESTLRYAKERFAQPETWEKYLKWRKAEFLKGNPLRLTPIPQDLPLNG